MFEWWAKVSPREQRLAVLTAILVGISFGYLGYTQAMNRIGTMDATIESLEENLVYYTEQMELLDEVDRAYNVVAAEHSSEWTQEEIHDRLRREIARLSLLRVPPPGERVSLSGGGQRLVDIREMPQGSLSVSEAGYREYQITIRTQPTAIRNVTMFLERLHKSPQALRIATLEMTRPPNIQAVTARINVIRTVIDTEKAGPAPIVVDPEKNWILNSGFEDWRDQYSPTHWTLDGATASVNRETVTEGKWGALVTATEAGATFYQTVELIGGGTFDLEFAIKSNGPVQVRAYDESSETFVGDAVTIDSQSTVQRYRLRMKVPDSRGTPVAIQAPVFVINNAGGEIAVDNVTLNHAGV